MANSTYLDYLPPVLWVPENDAPQVLGRHLRIYEKILTGWSADGFAVRAEAPITHAAANLVTLANPLDAAKFRPGDVVSVPGLGGGSATIKRISGDQIILLSLLGGGVPIGTVRIADLTPTQTTFRVTNADNLEPGRPLRILQAGKTEDLVVSNVTDSFITLISGLTQTYSMNIDDVPVKLLDPITVDHAGHAHLDFETQIDRLCDLFNPWRTRGDFLPRLASWVALSLNKDWSEYQGRKLVSQMVGIYQQRGLKEGLYTYLDIYAATAAQPRIVVDDGEAIFHCVFATDGTAVLRAIAHSNTISPASNPTKTVKVLLHPSGIAVDSNNQYFVCEDPPDVSQAIPASLWKVSASGEIEYAASGVLPMPKPIFSGPPLVKPSAVAVDSKDRCCVVDIGRIQSSTSLDSAIFRFAPTTNYSRTTVIDQTTTPVFPAIHPVDMILDGAGDFIVLDRGGHPTGYPPAGPSSPSIIVVSEGPPLTATPPHQLTTVVEPTALIMDANGRFIVADAQDQTTTTPADLIRVDPALGFAEISLLSGFLPPIANPLVFPTGLAWESPTVLLVCDVGLRWGFLQFDDSDRVMAEQPHLYRVDLSQTRPTITRVTTPRQLVNPTKMTWDKRNRLVITDRGESMNYPPYRNWRAHSNEFGLAVFFSGQRPTTIDDRNQFRGDIAQIIEGEKPGNTSWWIDF